MWKRVRPRAGKPDLVTWECRWYDPDRSQRRKSFSKKSEADAYRAEVETKLGNGSYIDPSRSRVLLGDYAEQWLAGRVRLKAKTLVGYRSLLDCWVLPRWGAVPLGDIHYEDVSAWVSELAAVLSASRTRQAYFLLTALLDEAVKGRRLQANVATGVELPRQPRSQRRYLTHEQVADLAAACGEQGVVVLILAYTGIRWGELAALRVREIGLDARRLHIAEAMADVNGKAVFGPTKTYADRWVPVPTFLREQVVARMAGKGPDDLLFTSPRGGVLRVQNFRRRVWDEAAESAGLAGLVPHELRHTAASLAVAAGANVKDVQQMLGHSSAAMTLDRYSHLFEDHLDAVAERLDAAFRARS